MGGRADGTSGHLAVDHDGEGEETDIDSGTLPHLLLLGTPPPLDPLVDVGSGWGAEGTS